MLRVYRRLYKEFSYLFGLKKNMSLIGCIKARLNRNRISEKYYTWDGFKVKLRGITDDLWLLQEFGSPKLYYIPDCVKKELKGLKVEIYDIGANIGLASLRFYRQLCNIVDNLKIYAVEPVSETAEILRINLKNNLLENNYQIFNMVVNSTGEHSSIDIPQSGLRTSFARTRKGNMGMKAEGGIKKIKGITVDEILSKDNVKKIIKIDVEGDEMEILNYNNEWLKNDNIILVFVESHEDLKISGYDFSDSHDNLLGAGFRMISNHIDNDRIYIR